MTLVQSYRPSEVAQSDDFHSGKSEDRLTHSANNSLTSIITSPAALQPPEPHILPEPQLNLMSESLTQIFKHVEAFTKEHTERTSMSQTNRSSEIELSSRKYLPIGRDVDVYDDDNVASIVYRAFDVIDQIDAGGKKLISVYKGKRPVYELHVWILTLDVFGSCLPLDCDLSVDPRYKSLNTLSSTIDNLSVLTHELEYKTNPVLV